MAKTTPRGIRNNNPLNIRWNPRNNWVGQTGCDGQFCIFMSPKYGVRAACKLLQRYAGKDGKTTVFEIINKWAPRTDGNDTNKYISTVCNAMAIKPTDTIDVHHRDTVVRLLFYMALVECGEKALDDAKICIIDFLDGWDLANCKYEKE